MPSNFWSTLPQRARDAHRPMMWAACIAILSILAFYVQLLHAAVSHGEHLKLERCKAAQVAGYVPRHCRG